MEIYNYCVVYNGPTYKTSFFFQLKLGSFWILLSYLLASLASGSIQISFLHVAKLSPNQYVYSVASVVFNSL